MLRNAWTIRVLLAAIVVLPATATRAATTTELDAEKIKAALHTTFPEEDGFVDRALKLVAEGKLPAKTVQSTFVWARGQSVHKFQHFKYGLLERVPNAAVRKELATGEASESPPPLSLGQRLAERLRRLFSFLPSVRVLLR